MKKITISKTINQDTETIFELISNAGIPSRMANSVIRHIPIIDPGQTGLEFFKVNPSFLEKKLLDWKQSRVEEDASEKPLEIGKIDIKYELAKKGAQATVVKYTISYEVRNSLANTLKNVLLARVLKRIAKINLEELNMVLNKSKVTVAA